MAFVVSEKNTQDLLKVIRRFFGQGVLEQMFHPAADMSVDRALRQRLKIEVGAGEIDGVWRDRDRYRRAYRRGRT